jgi:hypothetical protein
MTGGEAPKQLIVLGAGLTPAGELNASSTQRAQGAVHYDEVFDPHTIVFSGLYSPLHRAGSIPPTSEAEQMANEAADRGVSTDKIRIENRSRSTIGNFACIALGQIQADGTSEPYLRNEPVAVIAPARAQRRILLIGRKILTQPLVGYTPLSEYDEEAHLLDHFQMLTAWWALRSVPDHDPAAALARTQATHQRAEPFMPVLRWVYRNHQSTVSQPAQAA